MTVLPKNKERIKLLERLPLFWGNDMTDKEIATVIAGSMKAAEAVLKKHGLSWRRQKKYRRK